MADDLTSRNSGRVSAGNVDAVASAGSLLAMIASGKARSRGDLAEMSGLSRATISQRLSALFATGFVEEADETLPSGGRPARVLHLCPEFAVVLAADIGEDHVRLAVTDLSPSIIAEVTDRIDIRKGPVHVLSAITRHFSNLLKSLGRSKSDVLGIGLSLPAPVDFQGGRVFGPSVMAGWDDFDIRGWLNAEFDAPVVAENDVNLMALCEFHRFWPEANHMVFIKAGTGIGSGIVTEGHLYRGAQGAAGDIGHIQFDLRDPPLCRCGKLGCVEARAAGWAIARDLKHLGFDAYNGRDVIELLRQGKPDAVRLVREAGRVLGEAVATVVGVLNPEIIVVGGTLSSADEYLLSGVRELIYQRSLPLATRELKIVRAKGDAAAGLLGASYLVMGTVLHHQRIDAVIERFRHRLVQS